MARIRLRQIHGMPRIPGGRRRLHPLVVDAVLPVESCLIPRCSTVQANLQKKSQSRGCWAILNCQETITQKMGKWGGSRDKKNNKPSKDNKFSRAARGANNRCLKE